MCTYHSTVNAGYDSEFVQYATPPPPPTLPSYAYVFLVGLILGGFVVLLVVIRSQAKRLRSYSARLVAIGLRPRWTSSVLAMQTATIVGVGFFIGGVAATLGVELSTDNYAVIDVPVRPLAIACLSTLIAAGLAAASRSQLTDYQNPMSRRNSTPNAAQVYMHARAEREPTLAEALGVAMSRPRPMLLDS